jgi:mono/diheme cytochrome c family protein
VRDVILRRLSAPRSALAALALVAACGGTKIDPASTDHEVMYLRDAATRREALVDELVNPSNLYSSLRLAHYATGADGDWDRLPAWNPRAARYPASALDAAPAALALPADAQAFMLPDETKWDPTKPETGPSELATLGEDAFFRYPAQLAPPALAPLTRAAADRYGLWVDDVAGVGGIVIAETDAGPALAFSCASCHADVIESLLRPGLPSARVNLGLMLADSGASADITPNLLAWGPGRTDVTTSDASLPERVSDLRPVRFLSHLQYDATVKQLDLVSLAVRVETLIITSHGQATRPPRILALALAEYIWSLADNLPQATGATPQGRDLFNGTCGACHAGEGLTSAPRPLAEIGTDPACGLSPDRGTGYYRVPSLRGVSLRPTLFHDGTLAGLFGLLDPARLDDTYTAGARAPGPVKGHEFGLTLSDADRAVLLDYLDTL